MVSEPQVGRTKHGETQTRKGEWKGIWVTVVWADKEHHRTGEDVRPQVWDREGEIPQLIAGLPVAEAEVRKIGAGCGGQVPQLGGASAKRVFQQVQTGMQQTVGNKEHEPRREETTGNEVHWPLRGKWGYAMRDAEQQRYICLQYAR